VREPEASARAHGGREWSEGLKKRLTRVSKGDNLVFHVYHLSRRRGFEGGYENELAGVIGREDLDGGQMVPR
jgi:hypothetical protein